MCSMRVKEGFSFSVVLLCRRGLSPVLCSVTNVEWYENWHASSSSLYPFVCVHVEEKRELDGMELLFTVVIHL